MRRLEDAQRRLLAQQETGRAEAAQLNTDLAELRASAQHKHNTYTKLLDEVSQRYHRVMRRIIIGGSGAQFRTCFPSEFQPKAITFTPDCESYRPPGLAQ